MMERVRGLFVAVLVGAVILMAAGCGEEAEPEPAEPRPQAVEPEPEPEAAEPEPEAAEPADPDVEHARALWTRIEDYENWTEPEGFEGWQEGQSPHGQILRYYVNDVGEESLTQDGAVIVKENYSEESDDALMSVTVMEKREGYDPETKDWFYVKYSPDGGVMENPAGKKLAGLVGKGAGKGCIPCHAAAGGEDYLFMND